MERRKGGGRRNVIRIFVMSVRSKRNLRMKGRMRSVNRGLRRRKFRFVTKTGKRTDLMNSQGFCRTLFTGTRCSTHLVQTLAGEDKGLRSFISSTDA